MKESIKSYTELEVWKQVRTLVKDIYLAMAAFLKEEVFGLTNQMRRSAVSISSNIAEGCGRNFPKDNIQFFLIARGSLYELETQLLLSSDFGFINEDDVENLLRGILNSRKLLNGFIRYYQQLKNKAETLLVTHNT